MMRIQNIFKTLFLAFVSIGIFSLSAIAFPAVQEQSKKQTALKLAGIFGNNMVLQRNTDVLIWGTAVPRSAVTMQVSWSEDSLGTIADKEGKWRLRVRTPEASRGLGIVVKSGGKTVELKNVLSGEVWICSGQSNMQWKLRGFGLDHFKEDVDKAKYPNIRFCHVPQVISLREQDDVKTQWSVCTPQSALQFSAVAYFFGSRLHEELDVPVGLISTSWGGSAIEGWMSPQVLEKEVKGYKNLTKRYAQWISESGDSYGRSTKKPRGLNQSSPGVLYNSMLKPLIPFSFRGVIWYQGESNVHNPMGYRKFFPAMIRDWRKQWQQGDFPFYYVQIAPFSYKRNPLPAAMLREAQMMALSEVNTGMVVTMDVGDETNIHPKEKKPVGERLALLALKNDYGKRALVSSGPLFKGYQVEGKKIRLSFDHLGSGLSVREGGELTHFTIAGDDRRFVPAKAVIDGDTIVVTSGIVAKPVSVRFGWGNADEPNLMNKEGLPASSFRTDTWLIQ